MEKSTILVVDDNPGSANVLVEYLHVAGFETLVASNGEQALRQLEFTQPDLILLDVLMPGMDGFETCRRVKEHETTRDIPVIFMTAVAETVEKVKGFEAGGIDYITKPVQFEEVVARLNTHLTIRELQQQLRKESERFQKLAEATFEGILIHDDGRIIEINQTLENMFGYQRSEVLDRNVTDFVTSESRQIVLEHVQAQDDAPYEAEGVGKDGSIFPIEIQARTIPYQGRNVRVVAIRDLGWRKVVEEEKQQLLSSTIQDRYKFGDIIGKSPVMQEVYQSIVRASSSDASMVVCGESGTGKELVARTVHHLSTRKEQAFVAVNCGAIPEPLFEREFFGHRKGAFTGATMDRPGYFDRAQRGTLFLDEVGELAPPLQVKLLRALQEKEYTPLGDTVSKHVDVRIMAATNKNLKEQLQHGLIRKDFFYRIRVIVINLPPLRDRREDIPLLIEHFLGQYCDKSEGITIPARIIEALCAYHWPGNIRELQNELQRYLAEQRLEFLSDLHVDPNDEDDNLANLELREALEEFEKRYILRVFEQNHRHRGKTAKRLGLPLRTFQRKIKKFGLI